MFSGYVNRTNKSSHLVVSTAQKNMKHTCSNHRELFSSWILRIRPGLSFILEENYVRGCKIKCTLSVRTCIVCLLLTLLKFRVVFTQHTDFVTFNNSSFMSPPPSRYPSIYPLLSCGVCLKSIHALQFCDQYIFINLLIVHYSIYLTQC